MSAPHLGFYNTATTRHHVRHLFSTHAAAGGNVAPLSAFEAADLRIYKATDGAAFSDTQRSSANGITMVSPFDTLTGFHGFDIDLSDNTDSGFYATGCLYYVVLAPDTETVDGQTITGVVLAVFEIGPQPVNVTHFGGTAGTFSAGRPEVNTTHAAGTAWNSGAIGPNTLASDTITAAKIADNTITAAKIAADAIGSSQLAASAVTEIQSGLATAAALATVASYIDTEIAQLVTDVTAILAAVDTEIAAIKAKTDQLVFTTANRVDCQVFGMQNDVITAAAIAANAITDAKVAADVTIASVTGAVGSVTGAVGSVTGAVGSVTGNVGGNVVGSIGSLAAQAKADVNAEVVDAVNVDTYAEPGQGAPPAAPSIRLMNHYVYKAWRNRFTQSSSEYALYADNGTTKDHEAPVSDNGTIFDRGEVVTGA